MKPIAMLTTCFVVLALPGMALAQGSSTCQAYNPQLVSLAGCSGKSPTLGHVTVTAPPPPPPTSIRLVSLTTHSGNLPFTGLDVALLAAGGVTLLGAGFIVRRLTAGPKK